MTGEAGRTCASRSDDVLEGQGGICAVALPWRASTGLRERGIRRCIFQGHDAVVQLASEGVGVRRHFGKLQVAEILMRLRMARQAGGRMRS